MVGMTLHCLTAEGGCGSMSASPGFQPTTNQLYQISSNSASASYYEVSISTNKGDTKRHMPAISTDTHLASILLYENASSSAPSILL